LADGTKVSAGKFLELFQFTPDQQYTYISKLSGGEKKRLQLLSILFSNPNFLILDEPTNDLDLVTLTVLEDFLEQYQGCIIIVSHDRYFMDKLVDHLFVFEGDGVVNDFPGNYSQWRSDEMRKKKNQEPKIKNTELTGAVKTEENIPGSATSSAAAKSEKKKLTFKEKLEFEALQKEVPAFEKQKAELNDKINSGNLPYDELNKLLEKMTYVSGQLETKELRWLELSEFA